MNEETKEILERLKEDEQILTDSHAEVAFAEGKMNEALSDYEDTKHELEVTDYAAFKEWQQTQI